MCRRPTETPEYETQGWYPYGQRYARWQEDRPMLFAGLYNAIPQDCLAERIARFTAGGLNTFICSRPANALPFIRAAHEADLAWACWGHGGKEAIAEAMKIPGHSFLMPGDEPSDDRPEKLAEIVKLNEWVRETYPETIAFVNLSIAKADHDAYIRRCQPDVFSFDHYPLHRDGTTNGSYLYNLAWGRQTAMRHHLPYWMYLQSFGRVRDRPTYAYRIPDEADIRFLVFTFLAHGGTGVQWFIYYGYEESVVMDCSREGPPGKSPEPSPYENEDATRAWHAVRDVAPEAQILAQAILNLRPIGEIGYVGNGMLWDHDAPEFSRYSPVIPFRNRPFSGRGLLRSVEILGEKEMGALVGFLVDRAGQEYFMVVNLQHGPNQTKIDGLKTLRLVLDQGVEKIERLNRMTGCVEVLATKADDRRRVLDVRLEGGTGDLFKWSNGKPWALR